MKYIIKYGVAFILVSIGVTAIAFTGNIKIGSIWHLITLLCALLITIPAYAYWVEKIDNHLK